jgi:2,5-furandicarboxylate decarboxylase 1
VSAPSTQDLHDWLAAYQRTHPDDVLVVDERLGWDQDVTALALGLWAEGRAPIVVCPDVDTLDVPVVTNVFASRERVAGLLGTDTAGLHAAFHRAASKRLAPHVAATGPVLDERWDGDAVDLTRLPMLRHFEQDRARYWTSAVVLADDPVSGVGNASYHRSMVASRNELATSLHSRGHLWRYLQNAAERREPLPVAVVVGGHPLFLLACSARVAMDIDERDIAGGLFGAPLEVVETPTFGIAVPATSDLVLEGVIDPAARADEGPFGEFSGYASDRSTNNVIQVSTVLRRRDGMLLDVVSGSSADHLNLGRIPRESELAQAIRERFPEVTAIEYPSSGTHFHCYVSLRPRLAGQARQVLLALLGLDPYVKLAVAVDDDVDVRQEAEVLWAVATRFQADRDLIVVEGVPGSLLDPSAEGGLTARMGMDATAPAGFSAERASLSPDAVERAGRILHGGDG